MERMIVQKFHRQHHVPDQDAQGRRLDAESHFHGKRRTGGVHTTADPAGAAGDEDGVARIAPDHDDLVAAKQSGHRIHVHDLALFQVRHRVERKGARHAGNGIEIYVLDMPIASQKLLDLVVRQGFSGIRRRDGHLGGVWIGNAAL